MLGVGLEALTLKTTRTSCKQTHGEFKRMKEANRRALRAISALRRSLQADPDNIEALLDAGVSYTNELVQVEALVHLRNWLR
jgi:thioredoxin-like negative regulator of GroEL